MIPISHIQRNPLLISLLHPPAAFTVARTSEEPEGVAPPTPLDPAGSPPIPATIVVVLGSGADSICVLEPTTAMLADVASEISVPSTVATPPGVRIRSEASEYWVRLLAG